MIAYILRRLALIPVVLFGASILVFSILQMVPPYQRVFAYVTDPVRIKTAEIEQLIKRYGLDDPLPVQYANWLKRLSHGNLGWSQTAKMPVAQAIAQFFPATLELALFAFLPTVALGIWFGVVAAVRHGTTIDYVIRTMAIIGWSFPTFIVGVLILMVFYGEFHLFPPERLSLWAVQTVGSANFISYTHLNTVDALLNLRFDIFLDALRHLIAPVLTLSFVMWALILRIMRSNMLDTLQKDYVAVARAKGLPENTVIRKYAVRNALLPVVTIAGEMALWLINGDVVAETIFNYKGIGFWAANAAMRLDIPAILGITLTSSFLLVFINLVVDVCYTFLDPQVRML